MNNSNSILSNQQQYRSQLFVSKIAKVLLPYSMAISFLLLWGTRVITSSMLIKKGNVESGSNVVVNLPSWFKFPIYSIFLCIAIIVVFIYLGRINRNIPRKYSIYYAGMWMYSIILLAFLSTDPMYIITTISGLSGKMAPGPIMAIGLFFLAATKDAWPIVRNTLILMIIIAMIVWFYSIFQLNYSSRLLAYRWVWAPALVLEISAIISVGICQKSSIFVRIISYVPLLALVLSGIVEQTRLVFVMLFVQILGYGFIRFRSIKLSNTHIIKRILAFIAVTLCTAAILYTIFDHHFKMFEDSVIGDSTAALINRIDRDSRSYQLEGPFFKHFWPVFPIGAGYPAADEYTGDGEFGLDSGYIASTYVVGVPMMICFIGMLVVPVIRALFLRLAAVDAAVVAGAFAYVVRFTSSTIPIFQIDFFIFILLAGRCAYLISATRNNLYVL